MKQLLNKTSQRDSEWTLLYHWNFNWPETDCDSYI